MKCFYVVETKKEFTKSLVEAVAIMSLGKT